MANLIEIRELGKTYASAGGVQTVLHGINLDVPEGQFLAIMGPSGSGKSTLMHILGFLDSADHGSYHFGGRNVTTLSGHDFAHLRRQDVGFVFQAFFLLPHLSVRENVMLPLMYAGKSGKERLAMADAAINAVGLADRRDYPAIKLSGGEKQRVAIARAIVHSPRVVFADEPTGNLDSKSGAQVMALLEQLHAEGHTVILVTHETGTAEHAERIVRLMDGAIVSDERVAVRRTSRSGLLEK